MMSQWIRMTKAKGYRVQTAFYLDLPIQLLYEFYYLPIKSELIR
jgi:hypothetical protein